MQIDYWFASYITENFNYAEAYLKNLNLQMA